MRVLAFAAVLLLAAPGWAQDREPDVSRRSGTLGGSQLGGATRQPWVDVLRELARPLDPPAFCGTPFSACDPVALGGPGDLDCAEGQVCRCVPSCPGCRDCAAGVCLPGVPPPLEPQTCEEHRQGLAREIDDMLERGDHCRQDRDCVWLDTRSPCGTSCGAFVNRRVARRLVRDLRRLGERRCAELAADGCQVSAPACQPLRPLCLRNRCIGQPLSPRAQLPPLPAPRPLRPIDPAFPGGGGGVVIRGGGVGFEIRAVLPDEIDGTLEDRSPP